MTYQLLPKTRTRPFLPANFDQLSQAGENDIEIIQLKRIESGHLIRFLQEMKITEATARIYLNEVIYRTWSNRISDYKIYNAIGFRNDIAGFELRTKLYKGKTSKYYSTVPGSDHSQVNIFMCVFDFLSAIELSKTNSLKYDSIILNYYPLRAVTINLVRKYSQINLFLPNTAAGIETVNFYRGAHHRVKDFSIELYPFPFTSINDLLIKHSES